MKTSEVRKEFVNLFEGLAQKYSRQSQYRLSAVCFSIKMSRQRRFYGTVNDKHNQRREKNQFCIIYAFISAIWVFAS